MENSFQTSFIPKKPMTSPLSGKEPRSLLSLLAIILMSISIIASVLLFAYKAYLTKQQQSLSASLTQARDSFEKDTVDELELFNRKMEVSKQILSNHIVLSPMFSLLGEITIPSVQYTKFEQSSDDKGFAVNVDGVARDYRSIALQADIFNSARGRSFKNVLFSNLVKDKNNNISFNLKFDVDSSLLSYQKNGL